MKSLLILLICMNSNISFAETLIVKLNDSFNQKTLSSFPGKWKKFTNYKSDYFSTLYKYEITGKASNEDISKLTSNPLVKSVERLINISTSSIDPAEISTSSSKDPLYIYQWGLDFQGQNVYNEKNDLENLLIKGTTESDINVEKLDELSKKFKRDVLVAVIDTGVDFQHPDLKDNIYKNLAECENGEIPFEFESTDPDDKQPGDCKGWNFTGKKEGGTNRPDDFVGHGTHIAGIISAVRNNDIGLSGISNRIKILPIKVLSNTTEDSQAIGTSDRLSSAILYAISMKADVINLSLGWPLSFDKDHLRNAVLEAVKKGVTVVAAAGNNDHSEPIMPCSYEGVICVGSNDPDTKVSDFSNFGAHVDVLAPGNNILSTYPTASDPLFFDINGYENKSGTSQSAPYVSALVATLKGIFPDISENEVKTRIYNSTEKSYDDGKKFANGSIINFSKAIRSTGKILKPNFKGFNRVKVTGDSNEFEFKINFNDYGTGVEKFNVNISNNKNIVFQKISYSLENGPKEITVKGKLKNLNTNLFQKFELTINHNNKSDTYSFEKRFYLDFSEIKNAKRFKIIGANPKSMTQMMTVNQMHHEYEFPFYYTSSKAKNGLAVSLFTQKADTIMNVGTGILPNAKSILSIHRVDANIDGTADILVRSLIEIENIDGDLDEDGNVKKDTTIMYSYFNEKMRPLFSKKEVIDGKKKRINQSNMKLKFEGVILQELEDFAFGKVTYKGYGTILVPVYMTYGKQPEADTNPNPFARLRKRAFSSKIYFYEPSIIEGEEVKLTTRTLNDNKFVDSIKKQIKFKPFEQIFVVKFVKQTFLDIKNGTFEVLLSHESERKLPRNYLLKVESLKDRKWSVERIRGESLNLSAFVTERAHDLSRKTQYKHDVDTQIIGYQKSSKLMWEEYSFSNNTLSSISVVQNDTADPLAFPIKTYLRGNTTFRFFLTPSKIFLETSKDGSKKKISFPIHVSTFLPGMLFREQHYPISLVDKGVNKPALYVDATQISSRNIYLVTTDDNDQIYAPVKFNINIPKGCRPLNPVIIGGYKYEYSIQCFKDKSSEIIYIPLEVE